MLLIPRSGALVKYETRDKAQRREISAYGTNSNIRLEDDEIYIKCALTGYGRLTQKFGA